MIRSTPAPGWMSALLKFAGVYNLAWGIAVILFPTLPFHWTGLPSPNYPSILQCLGMVIGVYGVGYWIAASDPVRHWPIVLVGLLGKIFGPIGFVWTALAGEFPWSSGIVVLTNDVAWWIPFTMILMHAARAQAEQVEAIGSFQAELERAKLPGGESLWELSQRQPALVVFVRHSGCTFCREALHDVGRQAEQIFAAGAVPVIVHMGSAADGEELLKWSGRSDLVAISDPERRLFRAFELRLGNFWQLSGPFVIWRALFGGTIFKYGFGKMVGTGLQLAGVFLLDHGQIVRGYRHRTSADRPDYASLACELPRTR